MQHIGTDIVWCYCRKVADLGEQQSVYEPPRLFFPYGNHSGFDLFVMMAAGLTGLLFVKYDYPLVSPVLGVIVGPIAETGFVRGWLLTGRELVSFLTSSTISIALIVLIVLSLAIMAYK